MMRARYLLFGLIIINFMILPVIAYSQTDTSLYVEHHAFHEGENTTAFYWNRTLNRTPVYVIYNNVRVDNWPGNVGIIYQRFQTWYAEPAWLPKVNKIFDLLTTLEIMGNATGETSPQYMKGQITYQITNLSSSYFRNLTSDFETTEVNRTTLWQTYGAWPYQIIKTDYGELNSTYVDYLKSTHGFMIFPFTAGSAWMEASSSHVTTFYEGGNVTYNVTTENRCNITAIVQNTANGNALAGSTFHIYDLTTATNEAFYLPYGAGSVSIPYKYDFYAVNATKSGYTGYPAFPTGKLPYTGTSCEGITLYAQLTGPPQSATNGTLTFFVHDASDYPLAIPGATVILNTGQVATTNLAGTAVFNLLILNETYNYSVKKPAYFPVDGDVIISTSGIYVEVELTQGIQPTATLTLLTTTPAPGIHDMNAEIRNITNMIAGDIFAMGALIWYTIFFTVIGMFFLAVRSIGGSGNFPKSLFPKLMWRGGKRGRGGSW
jgi:hypothetical protein